MRVGSKAVSLFFVVLGLTGYLLQSDKIDGTALPHLLLLLLLGLGLGLGLVLLPNTQLLSSSLPSPALALHSSCCLDLSPPWIQNPKFH